MTIYLLTNGDPHDFWVFGVYPSLESAEAARTALAGEALREDSRPDYGYFDECEIARCELGTRIDSWKDLDIVSERRRYDEYRIGALSSHPVDNRWSGPSPLTSPPDQRV